MGYRSDIALVLTKSGVKQFKNAMEKVDSQVATEAYALLNSADDHRFDEETGAEMWLWTSIKWYTSFYPDCKFIENTVLDLPCEEYLFCRIGEELEDNQEKGEFTDNPFEIDIVRYINVTPQNN